MRKALGLKEIADIYRDPFGGEEPTPTQQPVNLEGLENDPNLRINGKPLTDEMKQAYRHLIEVIKLSTK